MKTFQAKIDWWLFIPIAALLVGSTVPLVMLALVGADPKAKVTGWLFTVFMLGASACCIPLFLATRYIIEGEHLTIKAGLFYKKHIPISAIRKISETRNPISAPAPSLDRLEIHYNRFDSVVISPKDKWAMITELTQRNPSIEVNRKPS
ncbi:PH domain-containing protein [Parapedobacter composti]|uniref:PH domain-containing protein n=1 Tax=Parapedobacter composti TaxID=623281 RepID=A0A1I1L1R0_9SPHI|nr:PH domain-containing protein [Parapedobacter composti]SFC66986.1 PH domain-containing protein [Parapedobacter composti]